MKQHSIAVHIGLEHKSWVIPLELMINCTTTYGELLKKNLKGPL